MNSGQVSSSSSEKSLTGLYLILDEAWASRCSFHEVMLEAAEAGVKIVQYRNKTGSMKRASETAWVLRRLASERGMLFIINDRCDLAMAVQADGVHLGQQDLPAVLARKLVGEKMLIGLSTHTVDQVRMAEEEDVNYLGFGPIFSTGTKSNHDPIVGIAGVQHIRPLTSLPIFAIGGITPESVPQLKSVGVDGVAVASGILDAPDRSKAFSQFMSPFQGNA